MADYGLICRDAQGNVTLNITDRLTRIIGRITVDTVNGTSGTVTIPSEYGGGSAFVIFDAITTSWVKVDQKQYNQVSINGNTINYTNCISSFYYGMY